MKRHESDQSLSELGLFASPAGGRLLMQPWHKAVRLAVYTALWLAFFLPAEIRYRRGLGVPRCLHVLVFVTGMLFSVVLVETFS
jgi:hypothetical protein